MTGKQLAARVKTAATVTERWASTPLLSAVCVSTGDVEAINAANGLCLRLYADLPLDDEGMSVLINPSKVAPIAKVTSAITRMTVGEVNVNVRFENGASIAIPIALAWDADNADTWGAVSEYIDTSLAEPDPECITVSASAFRHAFCTCSRFASRDDSRVALGGVLWRGPKMVGCDGRTLCETTAPAPIDNEVIIPPSVFKILPRLIKKRDKYNLQLTVKERNLVFSAPWGHLACKKLDAIYPDHQRVKPEVAGDDVCSFVADATALVAACASVPRSTRNRTVILELSDGNVRICGVGGSTCPVDAASVAGEGTWQLEPDYVARTFGDLTGSQKFQSPGENLPWIVETATDYRLVMPLRSK